MQRISDPPITECETCGAPVTRVFHPIAVHFKGSGFYSTDYGRGSRKQEPSKDGAGGDEPKKPPKEKKEAAEA
jgi:predicted nucleic acid-binding Zn ribbon protein